MPVPARRRRGGRTGTCLARSRGVSTRLRVVIDARNVREKKSGVSNALEALLEHMLPMARDMRFLLLRHPSTRRPICDLEHVEELRLPGETKGAYTVLALGLAHRFAEWDLFHSPADLMPLGLGCPSVVTIHDLMWVEAPSLASAFWPSRLVNGVWFRANVSHSVRRARRVIAISHATREAIERVYPDQIGKVRVVHHGFDADRHSLGRGGPRSLLDRWIAPGCRYSLIVGQGSPYKNQARMVRAFVEATAGASDHKLVLVRRFSRVDLEMQRLLARPEVASRVVTLPHVSDEVLFALFSHARMLLFASLYEGFGLPALEAMGFGLPVLASTAPAVLEVTGEAALHADPTSHSDLVAKIRRLDTDEVLRERLVAEGRRRVACFAWERAARATLEVYREAAEERRRTRN